MVGVLVRQKYRVYVEGRQAERLQIRLNFAYADPRVYENIRPAEAQKRAIPRAGRLYYLEKHGRLLWRRLLFLNKFFHDFFVALPALGGGILVKPVPVKVVYGERPVRADFYALLGLMKESPANRTASPEFTSTSTLYLSTKIVSSKVSPLSENWAS